MADDPPKKTLTLKKKPATAVDATARPGPERKQRSGARARLVAQRELVKRKGDTPDKPALMPASTEPRRARPNRRAEEPIARHSKRDEDHRPRAGRPPVQEAPSIDDRPRSPRNRPLRHDSIRLTETFPVFTPCPHGLEEALCAELAALGFDDARTDRAGCRLTADWNGILRINLYSRLATRVLVQVAHAPVSTEDDILELAASTPWERWFGAEQTLRVDTSAIRSPMQSLQYCNLRAKDGICDRLRDREGARPDIDTVRPDARVHLFLDETTATLYLDTSGESLFKRGWRLDKGEAPIRENLAAGLLALSGWDPSAPLLDPFCGSGTILIEAAWIALGVPAGIWRPFAFERLRNHDERRWKDIKTEARARIATRLDTPLTGCDINPHAIEAALSNMERAWLTPGTIRFEVADARHVLPPANNGWLVTNPPYGERLDDGDDTLWWEWSQNLKQNYSGWHVSVISSDLDLPQKLRLKPRRRYPLHNGALDCRLFMFDMVKESYRREKK